MFNRVSPLILLLMITGPASAGLIDFENLGSLGYLEGDELTQGLMSDGNTVTFSTNDGNPYVADVGGSAFGFLPGDLPGGAVIPAVYFLTNGDGSNIAGDGDYAIGFSLGISSVSVDLYDFRNDGGAILGDVVTMTAYDINGIAIGSDAFDIIDGLPDASMAILAIADLNTAIYSITISHSGSDEGTGIDNIRFENCKNEEPVIPEPATIALTALGLSGLGLVRRKKKGNLISLPP